MSLRALQLAICPSPLLFFPLPKPTIPAHTLSQRPAARFGRMPRFRVTRSTLLLATLMVLAALFFFFTDSTSHTLSPAATTRIAEQQDSSGQRVLAHNNGVAPGHDNRAAQIAQVEEIMAEGYRYNPDGIVTGWDRVHRRLRKNGLLAQERHPIIELMDRGRRRWEALLKRCVGEYSRS